MLLRFIRSLRGYVSFIATGRTPERFINIVSRNGIRIWDVIRSENGLRASMYMDDYIKTRRLARKAGVKRKIEKKSGVPVLLRRYSGRTGLFIGAFAFILTVFIMSMFIWSIDVTGLDTISESEMRSLLRSHGLYIGAFKPFLDYTTVSRSVMLDNSRVGWMAVNVTGSYASVEIKEETEAPEIADIKEPCNVKASRDGTIISINAGEGKVLLKEGSGAVKGQLIVSGVMDDEQGGQRLVRAEAVIKASTGYAASFTVPKTCCFTEPETSTIERNSLSLFGASIPLTFRGVDEGETAVSDRLYCLSPLDTVIPVGLIKEHVTGIREKEIKIDYDSAEEILLRQAELYEIFTLSGRIVTDKAYRIKEDGNSFTMDVVYSCIEDIAVQTPIGVK